MGGIKTIRSSTHTGIARSDCIHMNLGGFFDMDIYSFTNIITGILKQFKIVLRPRCRFKGHFADGIAVQYGNATGKCTIGTITVDITTII